MPLFVLLACLGLPSLAAADTVSDELTKIEQQMFAVGFDNEPLASRVKRIELQVFGAEQSGDISSREARLAEIFQSALTPQAPVENANSEDLPPQPTPAQDVGQSRQDATDYPAVTALERTVFSRDFIYDDIEVRLSRLERRTFNQEYPNLALVDRLDRLQARYPADNRVMATGGSLPVESASAIDSLPASSQQLVGSGDVYAKLDALEGALMPTQRNGHLMITERLDKLEQVAFGYTYAGQSVDARVDRLIQGYQSRYAKPTRPMDGFTPVQPEPRYARQYRPNIQVGSGMVISEQSSTGSGFSPEMMSMIPPNLRQQLGVQNNTQTYSSPIQTTTQTNTQIDNAWGGTQSSSSSTVFGPPGTVYTEQRTILPPSGYYPTQPGMTYQSYTTTVDEFGNRVRTPLAYTGNPVVLQQLADIEIRVLGQVNTADTMPIRLMQLEQKILGRAYPGYPDADRINNINRALQYQSFGKTLGNSKAADIGRSAGSVLLGIPLTPPGQ